MVEQDFLKDELMSMFNDLACDEQDSVRLLAVEACIAIASLLSDEATKELIKPVMINLIEDKSWRVRYMVAEKFTDVRYFEPFLKNNTGLNYIT